MAKPLPARTMPALASGETPRHGQQVVTFDGHRAVILWTTARMVVGTDGKRHEAPRDDPDYWKTLVRLADGSTHRYTTATLKADL